MSELHFGQLKNFLKDSHAFRTTENFPKYIKNWTICVLIISRQGYVGILLTWISPSPPRAIAKTIRTPFCSQFSISMHDPYACMHMDLDLVLFSTLDLANKLLPSFENYLRIFSCSILKHSNGTNAKHDRLSINSRVILMNFF
jgi:hypothetical protein